MKPPPGSHVLASFGLAVILLACRVPHGDVPQLQVERADAPESASYHPTGTIREAVASLDTLRDVAMEASEAGIIDAVREVRRGRLDMALEMLLPLANGGDSAAVVAREMLGPLLLHHQQWGILSGGAEGPNPLFTAYQRAEPEVWSFPSDSVVLPLELTSVGTPTAEVMVNGEPYRFWIDTGAGLTVVSSAVAAEFGITLEEGTGRAGTATSRSVAVRPAIVREFGLGDITVRNHPVIVIEAGDLTLEGAVLGEGRIEIAGIVGWPIIKKLDLTLDFVGGRLIVRRPTLREVPARNLFWLGYPAVAVKAERGQELLFGLDTGARATSLGTGYLEATGAETSGTRRRAVGSAGGFESIEIGVLEEADLHLDGWRIRLSNADVAPVPIDGPVAFAGVLGSDLGNLGSLRIDFLNGRFEFEESEGPRVPAG